VSDSPLCAGFLRFAQIALAQSEVVYEILHAATGLWPGLCNGRGEFPFHGEARFAKLPEVSAKTADFR
jgi:hypothetical protein